MVNDRPRPPLVTGRSFAFTLNNYTADHEDDLRALSEKGAIYLIFGREIAPDTGTPHLQGYIRFDRTISPTGIKGLLPYGTHIENSYKNSTAEQNRTYCAKGGDYEEFGECPLDRVSAGKKRGAEVKEEWDLARVAAAEGRFEDIDSSMYVRNLTAFHRIHQFALEKAVPADNNVLRNYWYHGSSGCGKSRTARAEFPDRTYRKAKNKWWGGYQFEPVVIIDDVDPTHQVWIGAFLKEWSDHYRFNAEIKNGGIVIRPLIVIVTSQYTIAECFSDPETVSALQRRFTQRKFGRMQGESFWHPNIAPVDINQLCIPLPTDDHYIPEPDRVDPFVFPRFAPIQEQDRDELGEFEEGEEDDE